MERRWTFLIASLTNWISTVRTRVCSSIRGSGSRSFGTVSAFSKCPCLPHTEVIYVVFVVISIPKSKMTLLCDKDEWCRILSSLVNLGSWVLPTRCALEPRDSETPPGRDVVEKEKISGILYNFYSFPY